VLFIDEIIGDMIIISFRGPAFDSLFHVLLEFVAGFGNFTFCNVMSDSVLLLLSFLSTDSWCQPIWRELLPKHVKVGLILFNKLRVMKDD
jgi:hypothetical protein